MESDLRQRLVEIGDEVLGGFDAAADPDQVIGDAGPSIPPKPDNRSAAWACSGWEGRPG
jgi:hypothetical protein